MIDCRNTRLVLLAVLGLTGPATAWEAAGDTNVLGIEKAADPDRVPADRPGFGDSAELVPKGWFEMEGGLRFDDNQGGGTTTTVPSGLLLRTGIADSVELRLGFDGYDINAPGEDGPGNASVGFKIRVHDETTWTPAFSVLPTVALPAGDDAVAASKAEPSVHFIWAKQLTSRFSLGGNVNLTEQFEQRTGNRQLETAVSASGSYALTDRLSGYAEYYTQLPEGGARDTHAIDGGVSFLTTQHTQLDAFVGTGLNDVQSDVYAGFGIAHLF
ncbi:transporter [Salinisphaera sp. Q1T1-3]|uniref:transporter n=1 Tax=Salinisphaera sp. Q1T1-3 TaxID=2321229 RepID=UPI000E72C9AB|nr:transporter [Salinisphaera sp. Q1T1-3]RJS94114.1 transporter [Salinisphaera sp. Q1T1-3]